MILLLLGIAFLLATSSSLLATSGSGREGNGGDTSPKLHEGTVPGEISGYMSVTALGELWLTIFIDCYSILAKIDVVEDTFGEQMYSFAIVGIMEIARDVPQPIEQLEHESMTTTQFRTPEDALQKLIELAKKLKLDISKESLKSVPFAIECGWRTPEMCTKFIASLLEEKNEDDA